MNIAMIQFVLYLEVWATMAIRHFVLYLEVWVTMAMRQLFCIRSVGDYGHDSLFCI